MVVRVATTKNGADSCLAAEQNEIKVFQDDLYKYEKTHIHTASY